MNFVKNKKMNKFFNWIFLKNWQMNNFFIEFCRKTGKWIKFWIQFCQKTGKLKKNWIDFCRKMEKWIQFWIELNWNVCFFFSSSNAVKQYWLWGQGAINLKRVQFYNTSRLFVLHCIYPTQSLAAAPEGWRPRNNP